ncbi:MAG: antitoxin [Actinomycetota bacterium]|nr:antitoxin [Actinomycetota bacterium]MBW3642351.1 antitoxin [Actinomycetota bacterium]MDP9006253.1 antitoxin [Actinomycetota bacterium]
MSLLDKMKDKAGELARTHGDKIDRGLDKATEVVNRRTDGKHAGKLADLADRARGAVGGLAEPPRRPGGYDEEPPPPGPSPL